MSANLLSGVRAVFFDAVGTLLFPNPCATEVYAKAATRHGLRIAAEDLRTQFLAAYRAEEEVDRAAGWVTSEVREAMRWRRIVGDSLAGVDDPEHCFHDLFNHFGRPDAWRPNPQAAEVLDHLRERGIRVGIGSNDDARLLSVLDSIPELSLVRDRVVISAAVGYRKPALEFFRQVTRVAGCEPGEILFVGDDLENDYEGSRRAGLRAVLLEPRPDNASRTELVTDLRQILE